MNRPPAPPRRQSAGLTLIEFAIGVAIASILAASALPNLQGRIGAHRLGAATRALADDLRLARHSAMARNQALRLSFYAESEGSCYVIHTGSAAQCACNDGGGTAAQCSGGAQALKTVHLGRAGRISAVSNVASLRFDPLHGTVTPAGTVRLLGDDGRELRDIVSIVGRVRTCAVPPMVSGDAAC